MGDNNKVPTFCGICGTRLNETRSTNVSGYDIYTGEPKSVETGLRFCPNPTITDAGFGRVNKTSHPSYRLNSAGSWS